VFAVLFRLARHIATIQNKTTNSADAGGRLTIFQAPSISGGERESVYRSRAPYHRDRSDLIAAMAPLFVVGLPVKLAAGKMRSV
jgi:hypothetical protein